MFLCIDCGKQLKYNNKRCWGCYLQYIKIPSNCSHFKGGKPKCVDCNKQLRRCGAVRCRKCAKQGKLHPNWMDGRSCLPYSLEFNDILKTKIRIRDDYQCQNCMMTEEEHLIVVGSVLEVHHIDYNKKNCKENNLITTCKSCNIRANYNRDYWQELYTKLIVEKVTTYL